MSQWRKSTYSAQGETECVEVSAPRSGPSRRPARWRASGTTVSYRTSVRSG
ncbi:DUF397 domain-containing protein [Actinoallomurus sp. NPDC052274]|uniref:DUF397 domain-containing protein n=1 Tax=Actinoallomurus sp. NPDC052274 TaxID=3155420 RepID=UPI003429A503